MFSLAEVPGVARKIIMAWAHFNGRDLTLISTNNPFFCGRRLKIKIKTKMLIVFGQFEALNGFMLL